MSKKIIDTIVRNLREAGYEVDVQRCITISNAICTVLFIFSIADIFKYGIKEHFKRAYSEPGKQLLLGFVVEILVIFSCIEKK